MSKRRKSFSKHSLQTRPGVLALSPPRLRALAGVIIIAGAVVLAYLPALSGGFLLDDDLLLTTNPLIKAPDGLCRFWCTTEQADYWPMTNSTLWIEWRLWDMNSTGYHVTNLILHIVAALLMWVILRRLSIPGAFFAALLFAVHPVNVESVAWISQRKNVLAMVFFLLSILCYLGQFSSSSSDNAPGSADLAQGECGLLMGRWYWLSLAMFLLGMLSKGSVVILPVLLLGILWWRRTGTVPIFASAKMGLSPYVSRWDLIRTAPFFLVAAVLAVVNLWFQTHGTEVVIRTAGFAERLLGAGGVVWFYLYKAFLPLNLVFIYPQWRIEAGNLLWWLPLAAALAVSAVLWWYREGWSRPILFAWGFFCVSLVPVLGFTDVGFMKYSLVSDHYQHIAIMGVLGLAAAGWSEWRERSWGRVRTAAGAAAVVAAGTLAVLTYQQSGLYCDAVRLYQATLEKNPGSWLAHYNLGNALNNIGRPQEAIFHFEQALRLKPDFTEAHNNLAATWEAMGQRSQAIKCYEQILRLKPDYAEAHNNLANALTKIGRVQEAIEHYQQALHFRPEYAEFYNNLGAAYVALGQQLQAIEQYEQALRLRADYAEAHYNLATALINTDRTEEAIEHYEQALRFKPDYAQTHYNLGNALMKTGRTEEAIRHFEQILRVKPDYVEAHNNLGLALMKIGRTKEAIEEYEQALRLKPDYVEVHNNLGLALMKTGRAQEAIEHYEQALRLRPDSAEINAGLAAAYAETKRPAEAIAAAQKALDFARSKGQTALAKQIEDWLRSYRTNNP